MQLAQTYGPIVFLLGGIKVVVASTEDSAVAFLKTHDSAFASRPPTTLGRVLFYKRQTMGRAPYGQRFLHLRKLCMTELFSARRVDDFKQQRMEEVKCLMQELVSLASSMVDMRLKLYHLFFNMISRMLISKRYYDGSGEQSPEATEFIMNEISLVVGEIFCIGDYFPLLRWLDLNRFEDRVAAVAKNVDRFVGNIVKQRVERKACDVDDDFLDLLLKHRDNGDEYLQGDRIKALLLDLLTGGIDTSTTTVEWGLAELINHPSCMAKLQEELNRVIGPHRLVEETDFPNLPYLRACVTAPSSAAHAASLLHTGLQGDGLQRCQRNHAGCERVCHREGFYTVG